MIDSTAKMKIPELPAERVNIVLDTDTYNEIDDQFALSYALLSPEKIKIEACYAAPFYNERSDSPADGMEKSYNEIIKILKLTKQIDKIPVFRGSCDYLSDSAVPIESEAVNDLIERAMSCNNKPLYVVGIAAATNIASAIIKEPKIKEHIVVVWLGGHPHSWHSAEEFNLKQDVKAAQILFDSGVPLVHVPCKNVAEHLTTTVYELKENIADSGELGEYLYDIFLSYKKEPSCGWSKEIWDVANIAWLVNPDWAASAIVHSPILTDNMTWSFDPSRHFIREIRDIRRNAVFGDLFDKLERYAEGRII